MTKALGLTLALVLSLALTAAAEQGKGTIKSIDPADQSFTLEDGTKLSVSPGTLSDLAPGEKVEAVYEVRGGKNVVTNLDRRTSGSETSNFGARSENLRPLEQGE